jgi:diguanylate cyclase (GGDEF)-like protein
MGHQALVRFSVVVCVLTAVLEPLDALWRLGKGWDPFSIEILLLRALIIAVVGGSALISHKFSFVRRRVFWLHLLLPLFSALGFSLLSYTTGAEEGSTFIGMMFLLVVVSFTTPGGLRMGIPLVVLLTCAWPLTILTIKSISGESVDMVALMVRTSIIVTMGIVCLFLQGLFHRIRFEQASVQAHLEHTSNTDRLTGAANRRVFHARLQEEVASALRERAPLALVLFDLDHLKNINDSHGHLAGDAVLSKLSQAVLGEVRSIDVFARLGGDEFALILPGTHAEGARTLTSRIRKNLASAVVEVRRKTPVEISASMGIAVLDGEEGQPDELGKTLFDHADRAVYEVKQKGRGGVAIWSGEGPEMIQVES